MSTRVHELAKELGLKSQELIDRFPEWGLDVKPNALASLDPPTVDLIRGFVKGGSAPAKPAAEPAKPAAPTAPTAKAEPKSKAEPKAKAPSAPAAEPKEPARPSAAGPGSKPAAPPSPGASKPAAPSSAPLARPVAGQPSRSAPAPGGGPLAGHTPHRGDAAAPSAGSPRARRSATPAASPSSPTPPRRGADDASSSPKPLTRSDYMSSAGIRPPVQRPGTQSAPTSGPGRRAGDEQQHGGESHRRESSGHRRPLPPVAAPQAPPQHRTGGPGRPQPSSPETKTQRPEKRMTREDMLALMRSGQLGAQTPGGPRTSPGLPSRGGGRAGAAAPGLARGPVGQAPAPVEVEEEGRKSKGRVGSSADRAGRRARRNERAAGRRVSSPVPASAILGDDDDGRRGRGGRRSHRGGGRGAATVAPRKTHAEIEAPITVRTLSEALGIKVNDLLRKLMGMGQMATINAGLDDELAEMLALEFGMTLDITHERTAEDELLEAIEKPVEAENLVARPPVVTILGHVDHGKTSLLDRIRKSKVVQSESGGITQHIGAYQVEYEGKPITFVDTPGHEAFTAMRARGANVTDIVVLVVAADDGVMPQTIEAIAHAKAANVPIVVALNKIDLPNVDNAANISKILGELSQQELNPVEWGGDVEVVKTSTVTGEGINDLLATLDTIAELHELKADPIRPATGTCLEASLSEGRGVVATVLVREGTLRVGDVVVCGGGFGRVRALFDDQGQMVDEAGPSFPVEISGLDVVPTAGESFAVTDDIARAREVAETRRDRARDAAQADRQAITLENLYNKMAERAVKSLNLIIKADVQGSIEAIVKELEKLENPEVPIRILLKGVGGITESDVILADASQAIIVGYRVAPEDRAVTLADEKEIEIRRYDIIYQVTDDVKKAVEGLLVPEIKETHLGRAVVRQVFRISRIGVVAGCFVTQGTIERSAHVRLIREGREIYKGVIDALKRFKDDVKEVPQNFECGIRISNYDDVKIDDVIEAYRVEVIRRTL